MEALFNNVLVFTGAGLSKPLGLPTTAEFEEVINKSCSSDVLNELKAHLGDNAKDIEAILSIIGDLQRKDSFVYKYLERKKNQSSYSQIFPTLSKFIDNSIQSSIELKKKLYELLTEFNLSKAEALYKAIIAEIKALNSEACVSFFTANYDLTFENAYDNIADDLEKQFGISDVDLGFNIRRHKQHFDIQKGFEWKKDVIEYKKIHGSLDWHYDKKVCLKSGVSTKPDDPNTMPLLYPGFKGTPAEEPFITLHSQLFQRMMTADLLIFAGFAFRDQYINNLVDMAIMANPSLKVLCYNPAEIKDLPEESMLGMFVGKFKDRFKHIKERIDVKEEPLGIKRFVKISQNNGSHKKPVEESASANSKSNSRKVTI